MSNRTPKTLGLLYGICASVFLWVGTYQASAQSTQAPVAAHFTQESFANTTREIALAIEHALRAQIAAAAANALSQMESNQVNETLTIELGELIINPRKQEWIEQFESGIRSAYGDQASEEAIQKSVGLLREELEKLSTLQLESSVDVAIDVNLQQLDWQGFTVDPELNGQREKLLLIESRKVKAAPRLHIQNLSASIVNSKSSERVELADFSAVENEQGDSQYGFDEHVELPSIDLNAKTSISTDFFNTPLAPFTFEFEEVNFTSPDGGPVNIELPQAFKDRLGQRLFSENDFLNSVNELLSWESSKQLMQLGANELHGILNSLESQGVVLKPTFWLMRDSTGEFILEKGLAVRGEVPADLQAAQDNPNLKVIAVAHSEVPLSSRNLELRYDSENKVFLADVDLAEEQKFDWSVESVNIAEFFSALGLSQLDPLVESFKKHPIDTSKIKVRTSFQLPEGKTDDIKIKLPLMALRENPHSAPLIQFDTSSNTIEMPGIRQAVATTVRLSALPTLDDIVLDFRSEIAASAQIDRQAPQILDHFLALTFNDKKREREQALAQVINKLIEEFDSNAARSSAIPIGGGALQLRNISISDQSIEVTRLNDTDQLDEMIEAYGMTQDISSSLSSDERALTNREAEFRFFVGVDLPQELAIRLLDLQTEEANLTQMDLTLNSKSAVSLATIIKFVRDDADQLIPVLEYDSLASTFNSYSPILEGPKRPKYTGLDARGNVTVLGVSTGISNNSAIDSGRSMAGAGATQTSRGISNLAEASGQGFFSGLWSTAKGIANVGIGGARITAGAKITNNADQQVLDAVSAAWSKAQRELPESLREVVLTQTGVRASDPDLEISTRSPLSAIREQVISTIDEVMQKYPLHLPLGEIEINGEYPIPDAETMASNTFDSIMNGSAAYSFVDSLPFTNPALAKISETIFSSSKKQLEQIGDVVVPLLEDPDSPANLANILNDSVAPTISNAMNDQFQQALSGGSIEEAAEASDGFPMPNSACLVPHKQSDTMTVLAFADNKSINNSMPIVTDPSLIPARSNSSSASFLLDALELAALPNIPKIEEQIYDIAQWKTEELPNGIRKRDRAFVNDSLTIDIDKGTHRPQIETVLDKNNKPVLVGDLKVHATQKTYGPFQQEASPATDWIFALLTGFQGDLDTSDGNPNKAGISIRSPIEITSVFNIYDQSGELKSYQIDYSMERFAELGKISGGDGQWGTIADAAFRIIAQENLSALTGSIEIPAVGLPGLEDYFRVAVERPRLHPNLQADDRVSIPFRLAPTPLATELKDNPSSVSLDLENMQEDVGDWLSQRRGLSQLESHLNQASNSQWRKEVESDQSAPYLIRFENNQEAQVLFSKKHGHHLRLNAQIRENIPASHRASWLPANTEVIIPYSLYSEIDQQGRSEKLFHALEVMFQPSPDQNLADDQKLFIDYLNTVSFPKRLLIDR